MATLTLRVSDELAERLRQQAAERGQSLNGWATEVLQAVVDPENAGDDSSRTRERLARAGLLVVPTETPTPRPSREKFEKARAEAGRGTPLSDLVSWGRGD